MDEGTVLRDEESAACARFDAEDEMSEHDAEALREQAAAERKLLRELERENTPSLRNLLEENGYVEVKGKPIS